MAWSKNGDWQAYFNLPEHYCEDYLKKLGLEQQKPDRAFLDALVTQHQLMIPFENLDVTDFHKPISLRPADLYQRLILGKRGGYCFQLNGAFSLLLRALGFDAWLCLARQLQHDESVPVPATHCAIIVYLNGQRLFCDVGYGGPAPMTALDIDNGAEQLSNHELFYFSTQPVQNGVSSTHLGWITLVRKSTTSRTERALEQFTPVNFYLEDFYGLSLMRSFGDSAYETRHVKRRLPDGYIDLTADILTVNHHGDRTTETVSTEQLTTVLKQYFGIER